MSKLIFVRHAVSLNREKAAADGIADRNRPLTSKGIRDFRKHVSKNKKLFKGVELWVTSPYVRAKETLDIILEVLNIDEARIHITANLKPEGKPQKLIEWIKKRNEKTIVFVSHEPFLSEFLRKTLSKDSRIPKLKKGAIFVVDFRLKTQKNKLNGLSNP